MRRVKMLWLFVALSVVFVSLQILLMRYVSRSRNTAAVDSLRKVSYENLKQFLSACHSHSKPVFLLDPNILLNVISSNTSGTTDCRYLCVEQPVTVFAILDKLWKQEKGLIQVLQQQFSILSYSEGDPRLLSIDSPVATSKIPTHYFFSRLGHTVHLVVLYERKNKYWWHGAVPNDSNTRTELRNIGVSRENLSVGQHAGAFDKIDLAKVTIDGLQLRALRYPKTFLKQLPDSRFVECNYSRAQNFYLLNPPDRSSKALHFKDVARQTLSTAIETLGELDARYWLSSGTCLGWFRQCDIFPHGLDVDLGMWIKDYPTTLPNAFQMRGLFLKHMFGKLSDSFQLSFSGGELKLDIFFFYEEEDYMWNGGTEARNGLKYKYLFDKFTLCWTEFLDHRVRIPCDTLTYIRANYGDHWFQPVKEWSWRKSPPNVRENGYWPEAERPKVIQVFEVDSDP